MKPIGVMRRAYKAPGGGTTDPLWSDVVLLINGVGSIYDAKGHTITNSGGVTIDTSDSDFPSGALRVTGGSFLSLADSADYDFPGDFTIEFDYKPVSKATSYPTLLSLYNVFGANGGMAFFDRHNSAAGVYSMAINGAFPQLNSVTATNGVKKRFRYVRSGSSLAQYVDGALINTLAQTGTRNAVGGIWIGTDGFAPTTGYVDALIGRIRITRAARTAPQGTAPYPEG